MLYLFKLIDLSVRHQHILLLFFFISACLSLLLFINTSLSIAMTGFASHKHVHQSSVTRLNSYHFSAPLLILTG